MTRENTELAGAIERLEADITANHAMTLGGAVVKVSDIRLILSALSAAPLHEGEGEDWSELERLARAAMKRAPGQWERDTEKGEGEYGIGDDTHSGFMVPYVMDSRGKRLFDAHASEIALIEEDHSFDENGADYSSWDQASCEVLDFSAAANPATILKLIASARSAPPPSAEVERLREALEKIASGYAGCDGFQDAQVIATEALSRKQEPGVPTPGDWIEWSGGPCPVASDVVVQRKYRDGVVGAEGTNTVVGHHGWAWSKRWPTEDIIAYRIVPTPGGEGE